jgi:hypothetical protein
VKVKRITSRPLRYNTGSEEKRVTVSTRNTKVSTSQTLASGRSLRCVTAQDSIPFAQVSSPPAVSTKNTHSRTATKLLSDCSIDLVNLSIAIIMPLPSESIHSEDDLAEWENSENDGDEEDSFQADDDDQQQEDVDSEDEHDDQEREVELDGGDDEIASDGDDDGDGDDDDESANIEDYATDDDADDGAAEQWDDEPGEDEENDDCT